MWSNKVFLRQCAYLSVCYNKTIIQRHLCCSLKLNSENSKELSKLKPTKFVRKDEVDVKVEREGLKESDEIGQMPDYLKKQISMNMIPKHQVEKMSQVALYFERVDEKRRNKESFSKAIATFLHRDKRRANHTDFIYHGLKQMKSFGVDKDLVAYNELLDVMPKGKYIAQNMWQVEFMHYPKQQECATDVLNQMEINGVVPDMETYHLVLNAFGDRSYVMRKCKRMLYWGGKFKHANPWPIPFPLPGDPTELARIALNRMCPDLTKKINIYRSKSDDEDEDPLWIASLQCPDQLKLIQVHNESNPLFVEGPFHVWCRDTKLDYFSLKSDPQIPMSQRKTNFDTWYEQEEDLNFTNPWTEEHAQDIIPKPTVHEQEDGNILAICITCDSSKESLMAWIKFLQLHAPQLSEIPVVFKLRSDTSQSQLVTQTEKQDSSVV